MPEKPITQDQFDEFKAHIDSKFEDLKKTLSPIVDPETGIFMRLSKSESATEAAHKRLDGIYNKAASNTSILKGDNGNPGLLDEVRQMKKFKANFIKVIWIMVTPMLMAFGFGLWMLLSKQ